MTLTVNRGEAGGVLRENEICGVFWRFNCGAFVKLLVLFLKSFRSVNNSFRTFDEKKVVR